MEEMTLKCKSNRRHRQQNREQCRQSLEREELRWGEMNK